MKHARTLTAAAVAGALWVAAPTTASAQETLRWHSMGQASADTIFTIAVSEILREELGLRFQITTGRPITRQILDAANNELELWTSASSVNHFMQTGSNMFAEMQDAPELFKNVRMLLNYPLGAYHIVTWADSGIETLADIEGKRVFLGPPAGAAAVVAAQLVDGATGFVAGEDFTWVQLDWVSGIQAFQDRQVDVHFSPTSIPSPDMVQLATMGRIRLLGVPDDRLDTEGVQAATAIPGRMVVQIGPDVYGDNQVNTEPVNTVQTMVGIGTNRFMDEERAYQITRLVFENVDRLAEEAQWMRVISPETALEEMNAPLHMGAYRYYRELGIEVPEALLPPELTE